jgi:hypothetical protein
MKRWDGDFWKQFGCSRKSQLMCWTGIEGDGDSAYERLELAGNAIEV